MTAASRKTTIRFSTATAMALLLAAAVLPVGPVFASDDAQAVADQPVEAAEITGAIGEDASAAELMIGDKVEVTFFEQLDLGQGPDGRMTADTRTFYQRLDLTGEHVVGSDGSISVPLLGRFVVAGLTPEEGEARIVDAYGSVMGRTGEVDIAIKERKPIFVTGVVKAPGAFPFEPGMVALQAIALAGGYDHGAEAAARLIEAQRERERHDRASERLTWLAARRDRLVDQRDAIMDAQPGEERTMNEDDAAAPAIAGETRVLEAEVAAHQAARVLQQAKLENARVQAETIRKVIDLVGNQVEIRSERMQVLQQMQGRGYASLENLWSAQREVGDLMMQKERLHAELVSAEHGMVETEAEAVQLVNDRRLQIERDLASVEEEIAQQAAVVEASAKLIAAFETATSGARIGEPLRMRILRRTPTQAVTMDAEEATDLLPGDVVKVEIATGTDAAVASAGAVVR